VHKMAQISRKPAQHLTSTQNGVDLLFSTSYKCTKWCKSLVHRTLKEHKMA